MDLYGKDKGNISLPPRLQPPDFKGEGLKEIIVNTQKAFYDLKISEIKRRIKRYLLKEHFGSLSKRLH